MEPLVGADEFRKAARTWRIVAGILWLFMAFLGLVVLGIAVGDDPSGPTQDRGAAEVVAGIALAASMVWLLVNMLVRARRFGRVLAAASRSQPQVQVTGTLATKAHQTASTPYSSGHLWTSYHIVVGSGTSTALDVKAMMRPDRNSRPGDRVLLQLYGDKGMVGGAVRNMRTNATFVIKVRIPAGAQLGAVATLPSPPRGDAGLGAGDIPGTHQPTAVPPVAGGAPAAGMSSSPQGLHSNAAAEDSAGALALIPPLLGPETLTAIATKWRRAIYRDIALVGGSYAALVLFAVLTFMIAPDGASFGLVAVLLCPVIVVLMWSMLRLMTHKEIPQDWKDAATQVHPDHQLQARVTKDSGTFNPLLASPYRRRLTLQAAGTHETLEVSAYRRFPFRAGQGAAVTVQWYSTDGDHTPGLLRVEATGETAPVKVHT